MKASPWVMAAYSLLAPALAAAANDLSALNRSLNPSPTPNVYGIDSHLTTPDLNVDQQGNHIFKPTPTPTAKERAAHLPQSQVTPTTEFLPVARDLRDFETRLEASEQGGLISHSQAQGFKDRLEILKIKYGIKQKPDGSGLNSGQRKKLKAELAALRKELLD
jgi:hypothetical protein